MGIVVVRGFASVASWAYQDSDGKVRVQSTLGGGRYTEYGEPIACASRDRCLRDVISRLREMGYPGPYLDGWGHPIEE